MSTIDNKYFCAEASLNSNESRFGTGVSADVWILLEYSNPWGKRAVAESTIPTIVKEHLGNLMQFSKRIKVLLIKQEPRSQWPRSLFVAFTSESDPQVFHAPLTTYEDVLKLDAERLLIGTIEMNHERVNHPLFLVCTHGKHDKCCAKFGFATYKFMQTLMPQSVWQASHVGGDRFASNVVSFPNGIFYGHVGNAAAERIISAELNKSIELENYRGRTCYTRQGQIAEYFVRKESGICEIESLFLQEVKETPDGSAWQGIFSTGNSERRFRVVFDQYESTFRNRMTCSAEHAKPATQYRLLEFSES